MLPFTNVHTDLAYAQKIAYQPVGLVLHQLRIEAESKEYGACTFEMNNKRIIFRVGKITPTKIGQFVTLWKRIERNPISPHDMEDPVDLFVVSVRTADRFGQFVFPKIVLHEKNIVSKDGIGGKRAMRVYPSWDVTNNQQAKKSQAWQLKYFFEVNPNDRIVNENILSLFM